jgi:predicted Zn-dependent protease with MMP-like domain
MSDPDTATFEHLAHQAMAALPSPFRAHLGGILVRIEEFADSETLDVLGIDDAWGLSGLYPAKCRPSSRSTGARCCANGTKPELI